MEKIEQQVAKLNALFDNRGFGFLHQNDNGTLKMYFFHFSEIASGVPEVGCEALFTPGTSPKGLIALNVEFFPKEIKASDVLAERARAAGLVALTTAGVQS
jgi:cold shock CspA family protein